MSIDLEDCLVESMRDYAASIVASDVIGLARRVRMRHRRRQLAIRGSLATGAAASVAAVLTITLAPAQPTPRALAEQPAADVTALAQRALAGHALDDVVYVRTTLRGPGIPGSPYVPGISVTGADSWSYGGLSRMAADATDGQLLATVGVQTRLKAVTATMVLYRSRTWWDLTSQLDSVRLKVPGAPACATYGILGGPSLGPAAPPSNWPQTIMHELGCGQMIETGRQVVDGQAVIRLEQVVPAVITFRTIYWVSASTYLPVRISMSSTSGKPWSEQEDFSWLRPTAANLAQLRVQVPVGFRQVHPPKAGYYLGFIP
jgi:hypothetical protein